MPFKGRLGVTAFGENPCLVLLDFDLQGRAFEFGMSLQQPVSGNPEANQLGVFFGYRRSRSDPDKRFRFLALRLDEASADGQGPRLVIGTQFVEDARGLQQEMCGALKPLPGAEGILPLPKLAPAAKGWRRLRVRANAQTVAVQVDDLKPVLLSLARVNQLHGWLEDGPIDPRGGVGIWARNGAGFFRDGFVITLADDFSP
jgi:hypothetical protein